MRPDYSVHQKRWIKINGTDVRDWDVRVLSLPPLSLARERIEEIIVPGRPEPVYEKTGEFDAKNMAVGLHIDSPDPMAAAYQIMAAQTVEFSNDPGFIYDCVIPDQMSIPRQILNWHNFTVVFRCSPLKRMTHEPIYQGAFVVTGTEPARPRITLQAGGSVPVDVEVTIDGQELTIQNVTGEIVVDCLNEKVKSDGVDISNRVLGRYPRLTPGTTAEATIVNATLISIEPNFRWR